VYYISQERETPNAWRKPYPKQQKRPLSAVEDFDMLIVGTPVEGFRPAKETIDFVKRLPNAESKKAIIFCTCALWKGRTFNVLKNELSRKGYDTKLTLSKKMKQDQPADFADSINKIKQALEK
jgi:flavodoxin